LLELAKIDRRRDLHGKEKSRTFAMDTLNGADQQAARENPVQARGHDSVAGTNVLRAISVLQDHAVIDHYKLQTESARAYHVSTLQIQLGRDTNFRSHSLSFGGALVRNDINAVLSEGCECTLNGLYLVGGEQHIDNHTSIDHAKPHAASHELYKGILEGHSTAVFNGKILVRTAPELHRKAVLSATAEGISLSQWISRQIELA